MKIYVDGCRVTVTRGFNCVTVDCASEQEARDMAFRLALAAANEGIE